ncbi:superinfection exclusion protein [Serratia fonticola]|uniref:superinfection exclusion protein n=1 Tax=Serratia fonticola TaxID=47917 RepID=UPI0027FA1E6A|nr:superinfection exclusion protein [Serratia fonticola]MDQ7209053.1 superinfection exclusion protein [Serratia fonticola]HBE9079129.1 superinfection exclusion protein [Serratia fonticola]HBE9089616.1 superinfection exclusion protein [Serratia fonticola]HBE9152337.1 superinfection exclusion protein [Serratia fonticola]
MSKFRVWHIPQIPGKPFLVEVPTVEEGVRLMNALADYDQFQLDHNIKPDYSNMNGLQMWDESLPDIDKWVDWYNDEYDDPREYIESLIETEEAA